VTALALRLAVAGGREQLARLLVAALGVALATGLLLLAGVLYPALHAHDARQAWTSTAVHNIRPAQNPASTDSLLWRLSIDHYDGKLITWVDVAALGPRAPLPPGLTRLPGPGELAVSPAMAQLLRTTPARILGDRYPGKVAATVGNAALVGPGQLIIFVGHAPAQLRAQPWVISVRSIESAPLTVPLTRQGQTVLGIGVMAILVPILVLVGTAARLSAARRERRLAAMRLIGATPRQIRVVAVVEAALAVVAGTVLGFGVFALIRPLAAHIDVDGSTFFLSDLRLSLGVAALVALGVPALGVSAALVSLRRVQISPLGVTRRAAAGQPTWRRLILLVLGLTAFAATLPALTNAQGGWVPVVILGTIGLVIVGIVVAGPLLTLTVGRLLARLARRPPALLAGRRLADNPAAGFRAISGLILAVFVVTLVSEFSAVTQAPTFDGHLRLPAGSVTAIIVGPQTPAMNSDQAATLISQLTGIAGVGRVIALRVAPSAPSSPSGAGAGAKGAGAKGAALTVVARCSDLLAANLARCSVPASTVSIDGASLDKDLSFNISDTDLARPVHGVTLDRLPLAVVVVTTNGQLPVIEAVRTRLDIAVGAAAEFLPMTTADIMAQNLLLTTELGRIGTAALLATLLIAGLSMAISIAGGLLERKQPFTLLRLSGLPLRDLHRMLLAETAVPLVTIAVISTGFGLAVAAYVLAVNHEPWLPPSAGYWPALAGGLLLALGVAAGATMPLLGRLTSPESARVE
jgi:hypothetical protein